MLDSKQVRKAARKLKKLLAKSWKRPLPEEVHKLRTHIRRIESAVEAVLPKPKPSERSLLRDLGRIRKRAGKVRDLDVLAANAITIPLVSAEREGMVELLHHLGAQRYKKAARLHNMARKEGSRLVKGIKRLASRTEDRMPDPEKLDGTSAVSKPLAKTLELFAELRQPSTLTPRNLHPYRLKVKQLRDVVRLVDKPMQPDLVETLGAVKDTIGEWHDWEELVSVAQNIWDGRSGSLLKKLKETSKKKYDHALATTWAMRRRFLRSKGGRLPESVLRTTAAMAS